MRYPKTAAPHHRTLAAVVLTLLALLVPVSAASAHDALTGMSPAEDETVEVMPEAIELSFTNPPVELGSEITVEDAEGTNWADGAVEIAGTVASQPLKPGAPAGEYTVTWRVVSSDSHPIEGVYSFTTTNGSQDASVGSSAPLESPSGEAQPQEEQQDEAPTTFPTSVLVVMIGLLVVLIIVIGVLARRKLGSSSGGNAG